MKKILAIVAAGALAASLTACSSGGAGAASGDKLKIGIKFDQPGLGLKTGDTYAGFDVDVATYIAGKLGKQPNQIEWVQTPSAQREDMIANGNVNFIVATYSITDSRKEKVSFAGPYLIAGQDLLVRSDENSITGIDSLNGKSSRAPPSPASPERPATRGCASSATSTGATRRPPRGPTSAEARGAA